MTRDTAEGLVEEIFEKIRAEITEGYLGHTIEKINNIADQVMNMSVRDALVELALNNDAQEMVLYDLMIRGEIKKRL